jgi:hypothetical protein
MNRVLMVVGAAVLMLGGVVEEAICAPALTESDRLAINGIGSVYVGLTVSEAEKISGRMFSKARDHVSRSDGSCAYFNANGLSGVSFMFIDGKVARIDVQNSKIMTLRGAKIGDSEAQVQALYSNQLKITPNPYRGDHFLTFYPKDSKDRAYRLIFATRKGKISALYSGKVPAVEYSEGCV